jgi:hypothetical protein
MKQLKSYPDGVLRLIHRCRRGVTTNGRPVCDGKASTVIHELDMVVLTNDLSTVGTVVLAHQNGAGFEMEFATFTSETLAIVTFQSDAVRPIGPHEIAHTRSVA